VLVSGHFNHFMQLPKCAEMKNYGKQLDRNYEKQSKKRGVRNERNHLLFPNLYLGAYLNRFVFHWTVSGPLSRAVGGIPSKA
jgi:hypothetical protein